MVWYGMGLWLGCALLLLLLLLHAYIIVYNRSCRRRSLCWR
jgi:hypothetical protein